MTGASDPSAARGGILFVLGAPRSGTSLVSRLLLDYFDYGMGPEGQWIGPTARRLAQFGDLRSDENLGRLIRHVLSSGMFHIVHEKYSDRFGWPVEVTEQKVRDALPERSYAGVVYGALEALARELRRTRVGSKDPSFVRHLDVLHDLFPTHARYLVVLRDGRDVALSTAKMAWGQKTAHANARLWVDTYTRIEAFRAGLPEERFLTLRYESLLQDPEANCRAIEAFLEAPLEAERRAGLVEELTSGRRNQNYEKWRTRMSTRDLRIYEAVAGEWLDRYGYPRTVENPSVSPFEHVFYLGSEYARRARRKAVVALGLHAGEGATSTARDAEGT